MQWLKININKYFKDHGNSTHMAEPNLFTFLHVKSFRQFVMCVSGEWSVAVRRCPQLTCEPATSTLVIAN